MANNTFYVIPKNSDLKHYGVLGMKWGVRKYQNDKGQLTFLGRQRYLHQLNKDYRKTRKIEIKKNNLDFNRAKKALRNADREYISRRIEATKNEKDKFRTYKKLLEAGGLPGSALDQQNDRISTRLVSQMRKTEGEAYTNKVLKSYRNERIAEIAVAGTVSVGLIAARVYLAAKANS